MELENYIIERYNDAHYDNDEFDDSYKEEVAEVLRELFLY